jgi:hypothetical protein
MGRNAFIKVETWEILGMKAKKYSKKGAEHDMQMTIKSSRLERECEV